MKKFLYATATKAVAVILLLVAVTLGALTVTDAFLRYEEAGDGIYRLETYFDNSRYMADRLVEPESILYWSARAIYEKNKPLSGKPSGEAGSFEQTESVEYDYTEEPPEEMGFEEDMEAATSPATETVVIPPEELHELLTKKLAVLEQTPHLTYFIRVGERTYTNCGATSEEELLEGRFFRCFRADENGNAYLDSTNGTGYSASGFDIVYEFGLTDFVICASYTDGYVTACETVWNTQAEIVVRAVGITLACLAVALLCLVYLLCTAGARADGTVRTLWMDRVWTEVHLVLGTGAFLGVLWLAVLLLDDHYNAYQSLPYPTLLALMGGGVALAMAVVTSALLSVARKLRGRCFCRTTLVTILLRWVFLGLRWLWRQLRRGLRVLGSLFTRWSRVALLGLLTLYSFAVFLCTLLAVEEPVFVLVLFALFGGAVWLVARRAWDMDRIREGARAIRGGDLCHRIPEARTAELTPLARDLNAIGEGLEQEVTERVKAERMKTELITNVSHDLKTPLTSIISYTELLTRVEGLPEEARDYVSVIATKSDRLRRLTRDLFDVSKAQSGNETFTPETLDAALLLEQTLGEFDNEITASGLCICPRKEEGLLFTADGPKLSRALGNLLDNALKYALAGTRVYVSAYRRGKDVVLELKNVSAEPLDVDPYELTGRFVRGDESRTDGGNGLGLAIAKAYAEGCGGRLELSVDGDLFKAALVFPETEGKRA